MTSGKNVVFSEIPAPSLGSERGSFLLAGSPEFVQLHTSVPVRSGWFRDPLDPDSNRARFFNGTKWTGQLRRINTTARPVDGETMVAASYQAAEVPSEPAHTVLPSMRRVPDQLLGEESGRFLEPEHVEALSQFVPDSEGWYVDPLGIGETRFFNGTKWTGQLRRITATLDSEGNAVPVALPEPDEFSRARATLTTTMPGVTPLLLSREGIVVGFNGTQWLEFIDEEWAPTRGDQPTASELPSAEDLGLAELPSAWLQEKQLIWELFRAAVAADFVRLYDLKHACLGELAALQQNHKGFWRQVAFLRWYEKALQSLRDADAFYSNTEVYGSIRTVARVLSTSGRDPEWLRYEQGPELIVLADALLFNGAQCDYDANVTVSLTVDGELLVSHRPTMTRMAALSILPGSALGPGLAFQKEKRVDERTAILTITHPDWQIAVQVIVDDLPAIRPIIHRLEARLTSIERDLVEEAKQLAAQQTKPGVTAGTKSGEMSVIEQLGKLSEMVESGFLTPVEAATLKASLLAQNVQS